MVSLIDISRALVELSLMFDVDIKDITQMRCRKRNIMDARRFLIYYLHNNKELSSFDITDVLGSSCNVSIIHKTSKSGNEFAQIGSISSMTKGTECPEQFNPNFIFNYEDNFNEDWLEQQPQWVQDQIKNTDEYKNKMNQQKFEGNPKRTRKEIREVIENLDTPTDDMPF